MSYLIMECARSYAVALDEEGRFVKVPNLGYEVGQRVEDVVVLDGPEAEVLEFSARRRGRGRLVAGVAAALLACAVLAGGVVVWRTPVGTVRMRINPEVSMEVNRLDRVVGLSGDNADGDALVEGFSYYGRTVDEVSDDLATRAEEQGYLDDGGTIEVTVESDDEDWKVATEDRLVVELEVHLEHRMIVVGPGELDAGEKDDDAARGDDADAGDEDDDAELAPPAPGQDSSPAPAPAPTGDRDDDWDDADDDNDDDDGWDSDDDDDGWDDSDDDDDGDDDD